MNKKIETKRIQRNENKKLDNYTKRIKELKETET